IRDGAGDVDGGVVGAQRDLLHDDALALWHHVDVAAQRASAADDLDVAQHDFVDGHDLDRRRTRRAGRRRVTLRAGGERRQRQLDVRAGQPHAAVLDAAREQRAKVGADAELGDANVGTRTDGQAVEVDGDAWVNAGADGADRHRLTERVAQPR